MIAVAGLVASVLVPVVGSGGCTVSSTQQAAPSAASQSVAFPDFDGDGAADLVHGVASNPRDEVVVTYGSGRSQRFGRSDVWCGDQPGQRHGVRSGTAGA